MGKVNIMVGGKIVAKLENTDFALKPNEEIGNLDHNLNLLAIMVKEALYFSPPSNRAYKYVLVHPDFLPSVTDVNKLTIFGLPVLFTKDLPSVGAEII